MSVVRTSLSAFPLSGFFTGGVAHGTGSSQNESRTGKSGRNIQHEATYVVGVHFSQTAKDTLEDKMKRLMKDDVKSSNF